MPDSERLQGLRRQRALVQEQLAWLDREIAALASEEPSGRANASKPVVPEVAPSVTPRARLPVAAQQSAFQATAPIDTAALFAKLAAEEKAAQSSTKRGCVLYFAAAIAAAAAALTLVYFLFYR